MSTQAEPRTYLGESTDGALVRAALDGDDDASRALMERHRERLVIFCRGRTHDEDLAEDLAQETLYRALSRLESFDRRRAMWPWLKHIAVNLVIDHARKMSRETVGLPIAADALEIEDDPVASVDERCVIAKALRHVPPRQSGALQLRYLEDWSPAETAVFFDTNRPAIQQLLHRARASFKVAYERTEARVPAIIALPFGPKLRHLVLRLRARVGAWDAPWQAVAPGMSAATAGLIAAVTVFGTGAFFIDGEPPLPTVDLPWVTAIEEGPTGAPDRGTWPTRSAIGPTPRDHGAHVSDAGGDGSRTIHEMRITAPSTGLLEEEAKADTETERSDDEATINARVERQLPGEALDGTTSGTVVGISCAFPGDVVCEGLDQLPAAS